MTENINEQTTNLEEVNQRKSVMVFNKALFSKFVINELQSSSSGRQLLKKYKQSEVREFIENYKSPANQEKLREISKILYVRSLQYQRLIKHFAKMAKFAYIIKPVKMIKNENKALKQYIEIAELIELMNLRHEMQKVMDTGFTEDIFYGYVHKKDKNSFYIQPMDSDYCKITHIEDGVYNYSIDMLKIQKYDASGKLGLFADEIKTKYNNWKNTTLKSKDKKLENWNWVALDSANTICIKINENILDAFPMFAGCFDSIFDIEGFKQLRKDREELDNYMILAQELPMRKDSDDNNDFMIDQDMMMFFHNMASDTVPENVGVITSPMKTTPITFSKDRQASDGVEQAEKSFWSATGTSQLLFNSDSSTSQGLLMSIKSDEEIVFGVLDQISRWINRYLKSQFGDLTFNVEILHVTEINQKEKLDMAVQLGTLGFPVKNRIASIFGISPLEMTEGLKLENKILGLTDSLIPLASTHTQGSDNGSSQSGRPKVDETKSGNISDEGLRARDKKS